MPYRSAKTLSALARRINPHGPKSKHCATPKPGDDRTHPEAIIGAERVARLRPPGFRRAKKVGSPSRTKRGHRGTEKNTTSVLARLLSVARGPPVG